MTVTQYRPVLDVLDAVIECNPGLSASSLAERLIQAVYDLQVSDPEIVRFLIRCENVLKAGSASEPAVIDAVALWARLEFDRHLSSLSTETGHTEGCEPRRESSPKGPNELHWLGPPMDLWIDADGKTWHLMDEAFVPHMNPLWHYLGTHDIVRGEDRAGKTQMTLRKIYVTWQ